MRLRPATASLPVTLLAPSCHTTTSHGTWQRQQDHSNQQSSDALCQVSVWGQVVTSKLRHYSGVAACMCLHHSVRLKASRVEQLSNPRPGRQPKEPPGPAPGPPAPPSGLTLGHVAGKPACHFVTLQRKALAPSGPHGTPSLRPKPHSAASAGVGSAPRRTD